MATRKVSQILAMELQFSWQAKRILQVELKKRGLGYRQLTEKLNTDFEYENERNVRNKIARGSFSAGFFVNCLLAMGCTSVELKYPDIDLKGLQQMGLEPDFGDE